MAVDLYTIEKFGNGGDYVFQAHDLVKAKGVDNQIYLSWFGGNVEADTPALRQPGEQDLSYWANSLLFKKNKYIMMNSTTERTLNRELNSSSRIAIENAMRTDLRNLSETHNISVSVEIVSTNRIRIQLKLIQPDGTEKIKFVTLNRNVITGDFDLNDFDLNDFF